MKSAVARYLEGIEKTEKFNQFVKENKDHLESWDGPLVLSQTTSRIIINNLHQLHPAREFMKVLFPGWKDELRSIFYSSGVGIATYCSEGVDFEIWLESPPDSFPLDILSPGCHWEKSDSTELNLVCQQHAS